MLLRDGETAILGGLIQDNERNSRILVPGLGDIPAVGAIFTSYNNSSDRSDVLLTITPRVVRGWEQASASERQFYSGTENSYQDRQLFAELKTGAVSDSGAPLAPKIDTNGLNRGGATTSTAAATQELPHTAPSEASVQTQQPLLGFSEAVYEVPLGQDFTIKLTGQNLAGAASLPIDILYNPQVMKFLRGEAGNPQPQSFTAAEGDKGVLSVKMTYAPDAAPKESAVIASLVMHADNTGVSYLIYRTKTVTGAKGEPINAQVRASRVVVK
jgi:general secretion pathway protein D